MNNENYHFKIGAFGCIALSDGVMTYAPPTFPPPAVFLFCNAPGDRIEKVLRGHNINIHQWIQWTSSYTCLLVNTGKCRVLVDTGAGRLSSSTGKLLDNLKNEGITPDDIDLVILSHAHPDHIGGNISTQGKPVFTNARWVIWEDEWQFWTTEQAESRLDEHSKEILINIARTNLLPLQSKIELVHEEVELVPGIRVIKSPGHTPGLLAISVVSGKDRLLYISDVVIHPIHIAEPEWFAATDVIPDQVIATRHKLLNQATLEKSLVMAFHFPFPGLGYILQKDKGWQWQPIKAKVK